MKSKKIYTAKDKKEYFLIFLCWLAYACAYLGKYSYTSNTAVIGPYYGVSNAEVGLVSSVFFIAYGIGQIVNGIFCKHYPQRLTITIALVVSAVINLILFFNIPFKFIKYLWLLNAIAQGVLWPTLVQIISTHIGKDKIKTAVLAMATTVATGTILSYVLSSIFVHINNFKLIFIVTGIFMTFVSVLWFIGFSKVAGELEQLKKQEISENATTEIKQVKAEKENSKKLYVTFYATVVCLAFFAVVNNFVKDGLNVWVPKILIDMYHLSEGLSTALTIILSVLGIFGAFTATFLNKYIKDFIIMCGVFFLVASCLEGSVLALFSTNLWWLVIICFGVISLVMHAINNVITSMFGLYLPDNSKAGFYSGILNGACYVGSAISSYGLGAVADNFGWMAVCKLLLICCCIPVIISLVVLIVKKIKGTKNKNIANEN